MQKKLIALAVAGLMSSAAFAQSSVTLSGRADAGYMLKKGPGKTTEAQVDGNHGTTEIWVKAKEQVNKYIETGADLNMRYTSGLSEGKDGMGKNDRKTMYIKFPFATAQFGVANLASGEYKLSTKPYAGNLGEWEGVKWSISQLGESQLSSRNTSVWTDPSLLKFGPVAVLFKGTFAGGTNRSTGANDGTATAGQTGSGDITVGGVEFSLFDKAVTGGYDVSNRATSAINTAMTWSHAYVSGNVIPKTLKLGAAYNSYRGDTGATAAVKGGFKYNTLSLHVNYVVTPSFEVGATYARLSDKGYDGADKMKGSGYMIGGNYFLSKSTILYAGFAKQKVDGDAVISWAGAKYDGTAANGVANVSLNDEQSIRFGIRKNF